MKVEYKGFEGELTYDMTLDRYEISGQNQDGHIATADCTACGGMASFGPVFNEFRISVDMLLYWESKDSGGDVIPEGSDDAEG